MTRPSRMDARLLRGARRMTPGSLEGRSEQAQARPSPPRASPYQATEERITFSHPGALTVTASDDAPVYDIERAFDTMFVAVRLAVAGSSSTVITLYLDGVSIGTVTLASSVTRQTAVFNNVGADAQDALSVRTTTAGTGAKSATVSCRMKA